MPIPIQSAIFVGFVIGSSTYFHIRLRRLFLAALISSLTWNWQSHTHITMPEAGSTKQGVPSIF